MRRQFKSAGRAIGWEVNRSFARESPDDIEQVDAQAVRTHLASILSSPQFLNSHRMRRFLRFVVEMTLEGNASRLKEFAIAVEVFDRDEHYDPSIDSIVRVEARRLRAKLLQYYDRSGGRDPVAIELRPGSYVPEFRRAPVRTIAGGRAAERVPEEVTIVVIPFLNRSQEPDQEFFCEGIADDISNALASMENVSVVARSSASLYKGKAVDVREAGRALGAQIVLDGSVQKEGDQVRISVQAAETERGCCLWSQSYRRVLRHVFDIQEEVSAAIADQVVVVLQRPLASRCIRGMAA